MTNDKPQWQGVTLYLVTTNSQAIWSAHDDLEAAAVDWHGEASGHVWEVQIGQAPVDVTDEARKLVEGE